MMERRGGVVEGMVFASLNSRDTPNSEPNDVITERFEK
jgi:hypothetical protein